MVDFMPEGTNIVPAGAVEPGVYILPTYSQGYSPVTVTFKVVATTGKESGEHTVTEYAFNCGDGTIVKGNFTVFVKGEANAYVTHTFKYAQGSTKYYGHTFYPDITIKTKDGAIKTMNHDKQKACEVWVKDPAYTKNKY